MNADKYKISTATSAQWRLVHANRPTEAGMPPLVPSTLPADNNRVYEERRSGDYFYKRFDLQMDSRSSAQSNQPPSHRFGAQANQQTASGFSAHSNQQASNKFSVQSRLSQYKK